MSILIEPKEIEIRGKKYVISKLPSMVGQELSYDFPLSYVMGLIPMPKIGDYRQIRKEATQTIFFYIGVPMPNGDTLRLSTRELVEAHVPHLEMVWMLIKEMVFYNISFFEQGRASTKLSEIAQKYQVLKAQISTVWSVVWSEAVKLRSPN